MSATQKHDWLTEALVSVAQTSPVVDDLWLSEYKTPFGLLPDVPEDERPLLVLRIAGHHPRQWPKPPSSGNWLPAVYEPLRIWLTLAYPHGLKITSGGVREHVDRAASSTTWQTLADALGGRAAIVAFRLDPPGVDPTLPKHLIVRDPDLQGPARRVDSQAYADLVNAAANPPEAHDPTLKKQNASINDGFQVWSRKLVTGQLSVQDLDGVLFLAAPRAQPRIVLLELKRAVDSNPARWQPYTADAPNYMVMRAATRKPTGAARAIDMTVNYGLEPDTPFRAWAHLLTSISHTEIVGVRHEVSAANPSELASRIFTKLDELAGQPFRSVK